MSVDTNATQTQEQAPNNSAVNFRKQEEKYQRMLAEKEARISEIEKQLHSRSSRDDDDDDSDPYVDKRKLSKELNKFGQQTKQEVERDIKNAVQEALAAERRQNWIKSNPDFAEVMQNADKLAKLDPEFADTILEMPDTFERQKLVYKNIKALGLHKPPEEKKTIQQTIDENRRSPYYQPTGVGTAPYASQGDYSKAGQKNGYDKLLELKSRLRI